MGQRFKNHYESTKHDAEYIVRQASAELPAVIVRPVIVVGDEHTGETAKFDGPYFGMIFIDRLRRVRFPLPYLGQSRAEVNVVPVNYLVDATVGLWRHEKAEGGTFAIADPHPMLAREMYAEMVRSLGAMGPLGTLPPPVVDLPLRLSTFRRIFRVPREVLTYFNHPAHYDCTRTTGLLEPEGIRCPDVREYLPVLVDWYVENRDRDELYMDPR